MESSRFTVEEHLVDVIHIKKKGSGEELVLHVQYLPELIHLLETYIQESDK